MPARTLAFFRFRSRFALALLGLLLLVAPPAVSHEIEDHPNLVIDTDMGLDDVIALAMALQNPRVKIAAIVACEGVAGREKSVEYLERLLDGFNRREIPLYAPVGTGAPKPPPSFRGFAGKAVERALSEETPPFHRTFAPDAYVVKGKKTVILVLGPLTNLAAALERKPAIAEGIEEVIMAGEPDRGFNASYDSAAMKTVRASGIPIEFVVPGSAGRKPKSWLEAPPVIGPGTSLGEALVQRLLADESVRTHYVERLGSFHDELAFLYYAGSKSFAPRGETKVFEPTGSEEVLRMLRNYLGHGRQRSRRVVFSDLSLPDEAFREDVRERRAAILARNGEEEWFAQLTMNELHDHLGAYSVVGVKMGLRAAELLNAPRHGMEVLSRVADRPPVSCLNDGVIVGTASTPGRALFRWTPGAPGSVQVEFSYNGRRIVLDIKEEYRKRIRFAIRQLLEKYSLEDREYWEGVRKFGLEVWETWHRRDLFEIVEPPPR